MDDAEEKRLQRIEAQRQMRMEMELLRLKQEQEEEEEDDDNDEIEIDSELVGEQDVENKGDGEEDGEH